MIEAFNKEIDLLSGNQIVSYELEKDGELLNSLVTSLVLTIGKTQTLSMVYNGDTGPKESKNKQIKRNTLDFKNDSHLKEHDAEIYEFKFIGTLEDIKNSDICIDTDNCFDDVLLSRLTKYLNDHNNNKRKTYK